MFISDKYVNTHNSRKRIIVWLGVAIFCFVFFIIYDRFSHNVRSPYMTYLFMLPLILGVLPEITIYVISILIKKSIIINRFTDNAYCSGVAALTISSMLRGIFDIAGVSSVYQKYLFYAGSLFVIVAIVQGIGYGIFNKIR